MTSQDQLESDAVAILLRVAGPRRSPPEASRLRVWRGVEKTWLQVQRRRRQRRIAVWAGVAATGLVLGLIFMIEGQSPPGQPAPVATVDTVIGPVESRIPDAPWAMLAAMAPTELAPGTQVRTGESGLLGLVLNGGVSLRLANSTAVQLDDGRHVRLLDGTVYVDTGPRGRPGSIELLTEAGTVQDFGTQFELQHPDRDKLRLRVREGRVVLSRATERLVADAGEQLAIASDGTASRSRLAPDEPAWRWAEALAPEPVIDKQPVSTLVRWVARETGRGYVFANEAAARLAEATILHGRTGRLEPLMALDVMLMATDLRYSLRDDGTIEISQK